MDKDRRVQVSTVRSPWETSQEDKRGDQGRLVDPVWKVQRRFYSLTTGLLGKVCDLPISFSASGRREVDAGFCFLSSFCLCSCFCVCGVLSSSIWDRK